MNNIEIAKASFFEGLDCLEKQDFACAENCFISTLELVPRSVPALSNLAIAQYEQKKIIEAIITAKKTIEIDPKNTDAYLMLSACYKEQEKYDDALATCEAIIEIDPSIVQAHSIRGYVLNKNKQYLKAIESFDRALAIQSGFPDVFLNRGNALQNLKRYDEAFAAYDKALALTPDLAEAWLGRGNTFFELKRHDEAFTAYDKALVIKPDLAKAWFGRGNILFELKRYVEALAAYDKALELEPSLAGVRAIGHLTKMHLCDWSNFDAECKELISSVRNKKENTDPFTFLGISSSPDDQLQNAKLWVAEKCPVSQEPIWRGERYGHDKIRVAYVSADFGEHVVASVIAGMFECHDKSHFDTTAISLGPDDNSEMRRRLKASFEHFIDVDTYSDDQIADLIRKSEIDILVDLMGFTAGSRPNIFARRPAPVQVNYLGYLGTMGAEYIDYIIADRFVIPESQHDFYVEKIAYLPNSFLPADRQRRISDKIFTRMEAGLPQQGFVFCCFNTKYKITPDVYDIWMRILKRVDRSVLWLIADSPKVERNLRKEAVTRGVNDERLIFAPRMPLSDHQARLRLADLFLDTVPYNAGATAIDTLWAGLPVLTRIGDTFVGRMAASALNAVGLSELITTTPETFEQTAIHLATNPENLAAIKRKLAENRLTKPLFDTRRFTKHIEAAYIMMHDRHQAGLPPAHIVVQN